jgi:hypothetical protein
MKLALMECGRKLGTYLRKRQAMKREAQRRDVFERYIGEISKAVNAINGTAAEKLYAALLEQARKRTAIADAQLDDEGKMIKKAAAAEEDNLKNDDSVVLVAQRVAISEAEAVANGTTTSADPESGARDEEDAQGRVKLTSKRKKKAKKPRDRDVE